MIHSNAPVLASAAMLIAGGASAAATTAPKTQAIAPAVTAIATPASAAARIPVYVSDAARSQLEFSGLQAGAVFKGVFKKFTLNAQFDPAQLAASHLDVQIDVNSLDSQDAERDKTMRSAEFFDVAKNPSAHYVTHSITKSPKGYAASGALTLRGVSREVPIEFQFSQGAGGAILLGDATLKRLDFGVGQGEWKSTEWVGDEVKIHFSVSLKPALERNVQDAALRRRCRRMRRRHPQATRRHHRAGAAHRYRQGQPGRQ